MEDNTLCKCAQQHRIRTVFVQDQSLKKPLACHLNYTDIRIRQHRATERREKLQDGSIGRAQGIATLRRMIEGGHPLILSIATQEKGNPIERIGKETPHGYRFGKPCRNIRSRKHWSRAA